MTRARIRGSSTGVAFHCPVAGRLHPGSPGTNEGAAVEEWGINPKTWALVSPYEKGHTFTQEEWLREQWPACPECGTTLHVPPLDVSDAANVEDHYIPGSPVECPRGCEPGKPR
jgi:hypothetical protein